MAWAKKTRNFLGTRSAAKRGTSPPGLDAGHSDEVRTLLGLLPGAKFLKKFHGVSFTVSGKVFCFTRPGGVVLKLPASRVEELTRTRQARPLVMGKRVMREWVVVMTERGPTEELELLREAMRFVAKI